MIRSHYIYYFNRYLQHKILQKQKPLLCGYKITHRCNLKCQICPFWKLSTPDNSYEDTINVIDKLFSTGVRLLIIEGGEPFLWNDGKYQLEDVILHAKKKFFNVGITTNGLVPIESSADTIWISIDGLQKTHDLNRGKSFNKIIKNIESSTHPHLLANITISKLNVTEIPELIKFLSNYVKGITIQFYYPFPNTENLSLSIDQKVTVLNELLELKNEHYPILNSRTVLKSMKKNTWKCHSWLIASVEPDGQITYGCYLKNRAEISCNKCGFAAHAEISKAFDLNLQAINNGRKIFKF